MSGMFEMVGKMIAHSLVQGGPGFPCLALPCFYYLVTGDIPYPCLGYSISNFQEYSLAGTCSVCFEFILKQSKDVL